MRAGPRGEVERAHAIPRVHGAGAGPHGPASDAGPALTHAALTRRAAPVPRIFYSSRVLHDLERLHASLVEQNAADAQLAIELIVDAIETLERHPNIGRAVRGLIRELVISRGRTGYVALYRVRPALDRVEVLAVRHQREAGYST